MVQFYFILYIVLRIAGLDRFYIINKKKSLNKPKEKKNADNKNISRSSQLLAERIQALTIKNEESESDDITDHSFLLQSYLCIFHRCCTEYNILSPYLLAQDSLPVS